MSRETDPLMPSNASGNESSRYYFLNKPETTTSTTNNLVRDADGIAVVESVPEGTAEEEFAPRVLPPVRHPSMRNQPTNGQGSRGPVGSNSSGGGFWSAIWGGGKPKGSNRKYGEVGTLQHQRKAPVKIEPKVFFANERTFLAWLHLSIVLAGASIAILAFADETNPFGQLYGIVLLPVAIAFIVYSMYQYSRRAYMIRRRMPGPYEDTVGPTVLGIMLMLSIVAQFALKLYALEMNS